MEFYQEENDFISELMMAIAPTVKKVHTDGVAIRALRKTRFFWEHNENVLNFTKWWPGARPPHGIGLSSHWFGLNFQ